VVFAGLGACKRTTESAPAPGVASATRAASAAPARPIRDARLSEVEALVDKWGSAQNALDFDAYAALYAPSFHGTKRVANSSFGFDRKRWLVDRKPMFAPGLKVRVSNLELAPAGANIVAFFEQHFETPMYRDRGRKLLAFAATSDGWRIVREEMLSSEVQGGGGSVAPLPGFFFARPDGVVLKSAIDERWLSPARRELAQRFRAARAATADDPTWVEDAFLQPNEVKLPPEVTAYEGKTLHVTRAPAPGSSELPAPCTSKITRVTLRNTAAPSFESVRAGMGYDHVFGTVVLGLFDKPCPGALWASEAAPGRQVLPRAATGALLDAARKLIRARADYPTLDVSLVGDASDGPLVFVRATRQSPDGELHALNLLLQADQGRPPLRSLGALAPDLVPRLAFDANGDGQLEVLTEPEGSFATVSVLLLQAGKILVHAVYQEPDFVCPG
jgi:ketosteroid isomerase-like protein